MFYVLHFTTLNLVIVSIINLQGSCLLVFSYPPLQKFKLERLLTEKTKISKLQWCVWNVLTLWNSKNTWFCVCESKSYIVAAITTKHANKFC